MVKPASGRRPKPPRKPDRGPSRWASILAKIPGGIYSIVLFIGALGGALTVFFSFWPASLTLHLACRPNEMLLTATNGLGQTAFVKSATFKMISRRRFQTDTAQDMNTDALEDPFEPDPKVREIARTQSRQYPWRGEIYEPGDQCQIFVTVELATGSTFPGQCTC